MIGAQTLVRGRRSFGARWGRVLDPVENVRMAFVIYKRAGFSPWRGGRYPC